MKKKSFVMWADPSWSKCTKKNLKRGVEGAWWPTGTHLYESPFNPYWHRPHTDNQGNDVVKVRVTIEVPK